MSNLCVVNIQIFGDFDMPTTVMNMIAPEGYSRASIKQAVEMVAEENKMTRDIADAVKQLKALGFSTVNSYNLKVGGGL